MMSKSAILKTLRSTDERAFLEIARSDDGFYRYTEFIWKEHDPYERKITGHDGYWGFGAYSGLFESIDECETGARSELVWLKRIV